MITRSFRAATFGIVECLEFKSDHITFNKMALRAYIGTARDVKFDDRVTEHTIPSNEVSGNTLDK